MWDYVRWWSSDDRLQVWWQVCLGTWSLDGLNREFHRRRVHLWGWDDWDVKLRKFNSDWKCLTISTDSTVYRSSNNWQRSALAHLCFFAATSARMLWFLVLSTEISTEFLGRQSCTKRSSANFSNQNRPGHYFAWTDFEGANMESVQ